MLDAIFYALKELGKSLLQEGIMKVGQSVIEDVKQKNALKDSSSKSNSSPTEYYFIVDEQGIAKKVPK